MGRDGADYSNVATGGQVNVTHPMHASQHEKGGSDEVSVEALSGELADEQPPKAHALSHQDGGADELSVAGLGGELADDQPPKAHAALHDEGAVDEIDAADLGSGVATDGHILTADGVGGAAWETLGILGLYNAYICVRDKKTSGTQGGTFTAGAWQTRDINDEQADTAAICSIASNQIILAAGTYRCCASAPGRGVDQHQIRLQNITDGTTLLLGANAAARDDYIACTRAPLVGRFILVVQKTLEIQHRCNQTYATAGFGIAGEFGDEIYTVAEFWREV